MQNQEVIWTTIQRYAKRNTHDWNLYDFMRDLKIDSELVDTISHGSKFQHFGTLLKNEFNHCEDMKRFLDLI